jgi:hypothetical protein
VGLQASPRKRLSGCTFWCHRALWGISLGVVAGCEGAVAAAGRAPAVVDLGEYALDDTGAVTKEVDFEVPAGSSSVMVHCGGFGDAALGVVQRLVDPAGAVVWDAADGTARSFRSDATDDGVTLLLPLAPERPLVSGTWHATVLVGPGKLSSMSCRMMAAPEDESGKPVLRLEITLVGFPEGHGASMGDTPHIRQMLRALRRDFASADVKVEVTWRDYQGADEATWSVIDVTDDDMSEFNGLLRLAHPEEPLAIPVFFVQEIANHSRGGSTILGLSAGPPGAAGLSGSSKSGLVVSAVDLEHSPKEVARILAHELGHFLGLFHTTEKKGGKADLLADTPECVEDADANGVMNSSECKKHGYDNVMWWTMGHKFSSFTDHQRWVLHHHPMVQP